MHRQRPITDWWMETQTLNRCFCHRSSYETLLLINSLCSNIFILTVLRSVWNAVHKPFNFWSVMQFELKQDMEWEKCGMRLDFIKWDWYDCVSWLLCAGIEWLKRKNLSAFCNGKSFWRTPKWFDFDKIISIWSFFFMMAMACLMNHAQENQDYKVNRVGHMLTKHPRKVQYVCMMIII